VNNTKTCEALLTAIEIYELRDKAATDIGFARAVIAAHEAKKTRGAMNEHAILSANDKIGAWLSAALEDPLACAEFKADINAWFAAGGHVDADVAKKPFVYWALTNDPDRSGMYWHESEAIEVVSDDGGEVIPLYRTPQSSTIPDGYEPVPIEPTMAMIAALGFNGDEDLAVGHAAISAQLVDAYKAMLEAAKESNRE